MKKIVLKVVTIHDDRSQTKAMKAITKLPGVDRVAVDKEKKTVNIRGDVDAVKLVNQIRNTGHNVELISVGSPDPPPEPPIPIVEEIPPPTLPQSCCCNQCQLVAIAYAPHYDYSDGCSIL